MKKKIAIILLGIISGIILSFPVFKKNTAKEEPSIFSLYILQIGAYKDYQNALEEKEKNKNAIIYPDGDLYRVIVGASVNEEGLEKIEKVFKEEKIHYYKNKLTIIKENEELLKKYNLMLEKTEEKEAILLLNQKILEKMV